MGPKCNHMYHHKREAEGDLTHKGADKAVRSWRQRISITATNQEMPAATRSQSLQRMDSLTETLVILVSDFWPPDL